MINEPKKTEEVTVEDLRHDASVEKKVPVIIELGDSNLDEITGGIAAYRCAPPR